MTLTTSAFNIENMQDNGVSHISSVCSESD